MSAEIFRNQMPIDRGWSWVVCLASFICMFITGTSMQTLAVLFLELVQEFQSSVTITSLTVMFFVLSLSVSSVISTSVFVPMFGERPVVAVSGALFAACSLGYFLAPNIIVFILFAAAKGTCVGMIFVPAVSLLSFYFQKRRSLATTICNSGISVAGIVAPPIIRAVAAEYGMRGTFLILAAVELHMVAAGFLMRPVKSYRPSPPKDIAASTPFLKDTSDTTTGIVPSKNISAGDNDDANGVNPDSVDKTSNSAGLKPQPPNGNLVSQIESPVNELDILIEQDLKQREEDSELSEVTYRKPKNHKYSRSDSASSRKLIKRISLQFIDSSDDPTRAHRDSVWSVTSGLEPATTGLGLAEPDVPDVEKSAWKNCCCIVILRRIFDPDLFRQWAYRLFLVSCLPSAVVQYLAQYIPTITALKGATRSQAATLVTILGAVDLVSRLIIGFFADTNILKPTQIVAISQICLGVICLFSPLFSTFHTLIAMVVLMGLFIGTRQSLIAIMHIEIVGMERMSRCLSVTAMLATISAACHSPFLSAVMESTGSFDIVLYYVGAALITGAVLILLTRLLVPIDARIEAKNKQ